MSEQPPKLSTSEQIERRLVAEAVRKSNLGEQPTKQEMAALARWEKRREEESRRQHYAAIPQRHYVEMSGRQRKILIEQAARYGIPCGGATIDLGAVLRWLHDFIAKNSHRMFGEDADGKALALERVRIATAETKEMEAAKKRGDLIPREDCIGMIGAFGAGLVRVLDILTATIGTEFSAWLADPRVAAMPVDERARLVREFVDRTCKDARSIEADEIMRLLNAAGEYEDA